jgi:hypothetical protein
MSSAPARTGGTSLTEDELFLFDALFDITLPLHALRKEEFAALNLPYSHNLDASELERAVRAFADAGRVRVTPNRRRPDLGPWIALTPAGGRLWELERRPDWDRFCIDFSRPEGSRGRWVLRIHSPLAAVAEQFLDAATACGLYAPMASRIARREVRARIVPWKPRQTLAEVRVPLRSVNEPARPVDWRRYETLRTWWRSIPELAPPEALEQHRR